MVEAPAVLQTERLILRKPVLEDAEVIFETYAHDEEVTRYLTWVANKNIEETRNYVERALAAWDRGSEFSWAITIKETGQLIGMIGTRIDSYLANLGYVLARAYWNKGYMSEAVKAVAHWALSQEEIYRVWAVCDVENVASARVLEKAGLQKEGVLHRWVILPNMSSKPRDCSCYSKVK